MIRIKQKQDCCGCYGCVSVCHENCISMATDPEGFWYPTVDTSACVNCGACERACPILNPFEKSKSDICSVYAAYTKNEQVRLQSSSGGLFTEIATYVISQGGVVFGATFDEHFNIVHTYTETLDGLEDLRGSKYVQSKIGNAYSVALKFLKQGRLVLFTGAPCQIEGLLSFLKRDYKNLLTQDIICHGVPSPMVWEKYIEYREEQSECDTKRIFFRHKRQGWKNYSVNFVFKNHTEYIETLKKDPYMKGFLSDMCLRPSCYNCHFKSKERKSDFTLADFWGIQNICLDMDDDKGTSLVFVNSDKGAKIFDAIKDSIVIKEVEADKAICFNSAMIKSAHKPKQREKFLGDMQAHDFPQVIQKYCKTNIYVRICGTIRRHLKK